MKKLTWLLLLLSTNAFCQSLKEIEANRVDLPNGWHLTPVGTKIKLGDLPLNIAVNPGGKYVAVTNNGQSIQSIMLIDTKTQTMVDSVTIPASWLGLAFGPDGKKLYASGGNENVIRCYNIDNGKLKKADTIKLGPPWKTRHDTDFNKISPAGLCIDNAGKRLYVVTKENDSLYVIDLAKNSIVHAQRLPAEGYTCLLSKDERKLYVSVWGGGEVLIYDISKNIFSDSVKVGSNPNDMALTGDGKYLFTANSNDNSVSVISTELHKVIETLNAALYPGSLEGSTTNSVGLSADSKALYIANADNNCLAVFDVSRPGHSASKGFIPTGWYPTCVRIVDGKLWVTNGKGFNSLPDPYGPNPMKRREKAEYRKGSTAGKPNSQYIGGGLLMGSMSIIPEPNEKLLSDYTGAVYHNTPYDINKALTADVPTGNPIPAKVGDASPIKYVFYVLKENRTYDQVLGDEPNGNGDTSLCLFPKRITPNEHAIAEQFVLLDNFYVDAEVSADGHNWSMAAYANDYTEKTWPTSYGDRGGTYDYSENRKIAMPIAGFIWDNCLRNHIKMRNYGEFADDGNPYSKDLRTNSCPYYPGWDLAIHDAYREQMWERDFDSLAAINAVPQFNIVYLPDDHTSGLAKGRFTPYASIADNDQALGKLIEHLSKSKIWKQCAIFVVEDDAQSGPDHVDAHRTTAYVAGAFVKRHYVDHTMYSTCSMMHTMELILGLPPMSQYDASATPMWRSFADTANGSSYTSIPSNINIDEKNVAFNDLMKRSDEFDLRHQDKVPENVFNEVLWMALKGNTPMPAAMHGAFIKPIKASDGDEDDDEDGDEN
jgi:YVTN family beta-propeller protein